MAAPSAAAAAAPPRPPARASRASWRRRGAASRSVRRRLRPAPKAAAAAAALLLASVGCWRACAFLPSPQPPPAPGAGGRGLAATALGLPLGFGVAAGTAGAIQEKSFEYEVLPSELLDNGAALTAKGEEVFLDSPQLPAPENAVAAGALPEEVGKALLSLNVGRAFQLLADSWAEFSESFSQSVEDGTVEWETIGYIFFGLAFTVNFLYLLWILAEALFGGPSDEEIREMKKLQMEQLQAQRAAAIAQMEREAEEDLEIGYVPEAIRASPEGKDLDPAFGVQDAQDPDLMLPPREEPSKAKAAPPPPPAPKQSA